MLAHISDQDYPVFGPKSQQEISHLVCAGQTRLIQHVEVLLPGKVRVSCSRQKRLQVPAGMPAWRSCFEAREVGAKPSTSKPLPSAWLRMTSSAVVFPAPAEPWIPCDQGW